jgi:hypothetical protein
MMAWMLPLIQPNPRHSELGMKRRAPEGEVEKKRVMGGRLTTVGGIVIPIAWDDEGNPLSVAISSPDEKEYLVEQDAKGEELLLLIRQEIVASGVVGKVVRGRKTLAVRSFGLKSGGDGRNRRRSKGSDGPVLGAGSTERIT